MSESNVVQYKMHAPQTAEEIRDQVQRIQEVMRSVMQSGTHYDVIPGTGGKPSLLKPGAEMLLTTFRIAVRPEVVNLSADGEIRYQVLAHGVHMATQVTVGVGIGECSSGEEKYSWRAAVCQAEFEDTPETRRRIKYRIDRNSPDGYARIPQVRTTPADAANTILKMAKKRAEVDLCLTALACSDIFTQDMAAEDGQPQRSAYADHPRAGSAAPRRTHAGNGLATEKQRALVSKKLDEAGIGENAFLAKFELGAMAELKFTQVDDALAWIRQGGA